MSSMRRRSAAAARRRARTAAVLAAPHAFAQGCPEKNIYYWQAFPSGGESDLSARHQQLVLKKKCPAIETVIQYKAGAGGALMWSQMNTLPGDGLNVVGINLPHTVLQPMEGNVQYKTEDLVPIFWYHFTPDALVVPEASPFKTFQDFLKAAQAALAGRLEFRERLELFIAPAGQHDGPGDGPWSLRSAGHPADGPPRPAGCKAGCRSAVGELAPPNSDRRSKSHS